MKIVFKNILIFLLMGILYYGIELLWRGYSYYQMIIMVMIISFLIDGLNEYLPWEMPLYQQIGISTVFAISIEFLSGLIFKTFGLILWDYSDMKYNLFGVIQLYYCFAWIPLSASAIFLSDFLRWLILNEEKPHYKLF